MKKNLFILMAILPLAGCCNINGTRTAADGSKLSITANRFLWSSQDLEFTTVDNSGVTVGLKAKVSHPDVEAINAVSAAAVAAITQTAKVAAQTP